MYEQERVITRVQQAVMRERDVRVCFLSGSFGRRTADAYSDLDVALLFADGAAREAAYARRRDFVQSILAYVAVKSFDATHIRPYFHIALYANGAKVDFRYEVQGELVPSHWDKDIRLLKDDGERWGEAFAAECGRVPRPALPSITAGALERLDNRFWVMLWDVYRQLRRGDVDKPFPIYMEAVQMALPELLPLLPEDDPARQAAVQLFYSREAGETAVGVHQLLEAYVALRSAVVQRHRLMFMANGGFEREILSLMKR